MGSKSSKRGDQTTTTAPPASPPSPPSPASPPPPNTRNSNTQMKPDLSSYQAACRADPDLQSFDANLHARTNRAINSIAVGIEVRSMSLDSLREVTECLLEMNQEVVNVILKSREDIWKNQELFGFVNDYFETSLSTLDFCTALEGCIKRALHSQSILQMALLRFGQEHQESSSAQASVTNDNVYGKTLEELRNFKNAGDPFTQEFFTIFQRVYGQQILMLEKLQAKKRKLDKRLKSIKTWRKVSNVIFVATFVGVIVCSVVAAAIIAPPVVTALAAAATVPLGSMGKWINSLWGKCEKEIRGQREIILNMQLGNYILIKDIDGIRVLVDRLQIEIEAIMQNAEFAMRGNEEVMIAVEEIKKKMDGFMNSIQDLSGHVDKCSRHIQRAKAVILRRIINYPESSSHGGGMLF